MSTATVSKATNQSMQQHIKDVKQSKEVSFAHPSEAETFFQYWRDYEKGPLLVSFENGRTFFRQA